MTLDGLRVDHGALDAAAQDLAHTVQEIDDRLGRLEHELAPLREDWSGNAQTAYLAAKVRWDRAMQEMGQLLDDTGHAVTRSNADYQAADRRGAASFGS